MPEPRPERRGDPRTLSRKQPGRSRNQDDPPPLPPREFSEQKHKEERQRIDPDLVPPSDTDVERREARGRGAMPYGLRGSRKGRRLDDHPPPGRNS